ncbi:unnamed protein product [Schistosoma rodhaini]|uniref:Uncharacterized protein n=1 Tax=Schistosoma rodhaini TaxID=6188 RepID=A0AA85FH74_9TREM|nr:unnamed protein product [Schistosoma rodhaini]
MFRNNKSSFRITLSLVCLLYTLGSSIKYLHLLHPIGHYKYNYSQPVDVNEARAHQIDNQQIRSVILYVTGICVLILGDLLLSYSVLYLVVRHVCKSVVRTKEMNVCCLTNSCSTTLDDFHDKSI